jgi:hypothetical protein
MYFYLILLYFLFSVSCNLHVLMWFDFLGEVFDASGRPSIAPSQFSVMSSLLQPCNSDCCLCRIGLFTKFFFILVPSCEALEKAWLIYSFS